MCSVIYKIQNNVTGKYYVGSAVNWINRKKNHKYNLRYNKHINPHLQNSWNKYGEDNFEFIVLEEVEDPKRLITREQAYLDLNTDGYNICKTAGSTLGRIHKESTKEKIGAAHRGKTLSDDTKKLMSFLKIGKKFKSACSCYI